MVTLVLLPGTDGTGDLFTPFLADFAGKAKVVRYPTSEALGYSELEQIARDALPVGEPFVLLGESFSGPIAVCLAASRPPNLLGVVLCCSSVKNPRPLLGPFGPLVNFLPAKPPLKLMEALLYPGFTSSGLRESLKRALAQVSSAALRARIRAVAHVDVVRQLQEVDVPILYLRATEDRVVPASAGAMVVAKAKNAKLVELAAPHFLLQSAPKPAANIIREFIAEVAKCPLTS
jgi:pimeloyl-[acyl-carrier protein] methyl ester esterase